MCRIFMASGDFIRSVSKKWLSDTFSGLENSMGGDGNGVYIQLKNRAVYKKGVSFSTGDAVSFVMKYQRNAQTVMFHTRMTSSGSTTDEMCHPFIGDNYALIHNGHVSWAHHNTLGLSDTGMVHRFLDYGVIKPYSLTEMPNYWAGIGPHGPFVATYKPGLRVLYDDPKHSSVWCVSSEVYSNPVPDILFLDTLPSVLWYPGMPIPFSANHLAESKLDTVWVSSGKGWYRQKGGYDWTDFYNTHTYIDGKYVKNEEVEK